MQTLAALCFFANGSYQTPVGKSLDFVVSQSAMSDYIEEVLNALNSPEVVGQFVRFPENVEEVNICVQR